MTFILFTLLSVISNSGEVRASWQVLDTFSGEGLNSEKWFLAKHNNTSHDSVVEIEKGRLRLKNYIWNRPGHRDVFHGENLRVQLADSTVEGMKADFWLKNISVSTCKKSKNASYSRVSLGGEFFSVFDSELKEVVDIDAVIKIGLVKNSESTSIPNEKLWVSAAILACNPNYDCSLFRQLTREGKKPTKRFVSLDLGNAQLGEKITLGIRNDRQKREFVFSRKSKGKEVVKRFKYPKNWKPLKLSYEYKRVDVGHFIANCEKERINSSIEARVDNFRVVQRKTR